MPSEHQTSAVWDMEPRYSDPQCINALLKNLFAFIFSPFRILRGYFFELLVNENVCFEGLPFESYQVHSSQSQVRFTTLHAAILKKVICTLW